ncbi:Late embryogenesis abundant (LEA) hydroxyproline-rich glycoprotein family [Striga hermonthica]|uniref:Late embryogenesis abundant (LEA) hydroxyproline-rich glycoprotein family n=1 Tax=Striga hermonthica TaxID=68872 RepID=A0A9N7NH81_STRHE|nr:Late embryogenesis abundant (LEA) hydroxyproline-rich glycoprotein family [Striga hermonthica]
MHFSGPIENVNRSTITAATKAARLPGPEPPDSASRAPEARNPPAFLPTAQTPPEGALLPDSPGGPTLDSRITARVRVKNPNQKLKMSYEKIRVLINEAKGGAVLGVGSARGFTQERNNVTSLKIDVKTEKGILGNANADELEKGFESKNLSVNVEISGKVGVKGDKWSAGSIGVKVVCEGVRLSRVERESPKCRIKVLDWYVS